jgi:nitroreductase
MDALDALFARRSIARLVDPAPTDDDLATMLAAAVAAPDHGELRPWRFVVLTGDDRLRLGDLMAAMALAAEGRANEGRANEGRANEGEAAATQARTRPLRAPMVVAAICRVQPGNIPAPEQRDAVASAVQNLLVAATALGYGGIWRTGPAATSPVVREGFGLGDDDSIVGFVYLGTIPDGAEKPPRRLDPTPFIEAPPAG